MTQGVSDRPDPGRGWWRKVFRHEDVLGGYTPIIRKVAHWLYKRHGGRIEYGELYSAGLLGLDDAIAKFDENKDTSFTGYAHYRIRGAMLDRLRAEDVVPRSVRLKLRDLETLVAAQERDRCAAGDVREAAASLGMNETQLSELYQHLAYFGSVSLSEITDGPDDERPRPDEGPPADDVLMPPSDEPSAVDRLSHDETSGYLAEAIAALPDKERAVVAMYYYDELKLREIGEILGVTESRVSQLRLQALKRLRDLMV